jgi:microcystin-dependent protein
MDPILGMIILWPGTFIPQGWFLCDGTLLNISQYQALFSLLGVLYGGNGSSTFGLPDLRGRVAISIGQGAGLSNYTLAQKAGLEAITLTQAQMPSHTHSAAGTVSGTATGTLPALSGTGSLPASSNLGTSDTPGPALFPAKAPDYGSAGLAPDLIYGASDNSTKMPVSVTIPGGSPLSVNLSGGTVPVTVGNTGGSSPFDNRNPFLALNYIIAWQGIYPQRP